MSTVVFRRPQRKTPPELPEGEIVLAPPPELPEQNQQVGQQLMMMLPMIAGAGAMALMYSSRGGGGPLMYVVGGLFGVSMLGMVAMNFLRPQQGGKAEVNSERRDYMRYLAQLRKQVRGNTTQQRSALTWRHPEPDLLWSTAASIRLWERRPSDDDFGLVRAGRGAQRLSTPLVTPQTAPVEDLEPMTSSALRRFVRTYSTVYDLPIALSLRGFAKISVHGERPDVTAAARALLCQLVTFHSHEDLQVWVCAAPERRESWEWTKWLPHAQHPTANDAAGPVRMVAERLEELEAWADPELAERPRFTPNTQLPADAPHIVVLVDGGVVSYDSPLADPDGVLGITFIDVGSRMLGGNAEAERNQLRLFADGEQLGVMGANGVEPLGVPDALTIAQAESVARVLAPLRLGAAGEEEGEEPLTSSMGLADLLNLGDPKDIDPAYTWRPRSARERLRVPIGVGADGAPVDLDIKESAEGGMGPHGLVIGATGSGKSELLRTHVLGLTVTHSSEQLNLVLVDFKGGATFAGLSELPHTAAVITNLQDDLTMVDRMHDALNGEMNRRQEVLRNAGNFQSVRDYEKARAQGQELEPLPSLFICCDEFSEMLTAKPEFTELFVAIGRLGRSLGMHLMLASQRLEEGKLRGLDSHLSYRIALRTFSGSESRTVIGVPDAYELPPVPGAGYMRPDPATLVRFKAAYVSGAYKSRSGVPRQSGGPSSLPADVLPFTSRYMPVPEVPKEESEGEQSQDEEAGAPGETVLDVMVDRLEGKGPPAHQVWLPPLIEPPSMDQLLPQIGVTPDRGLCPVGWQGNGRLTVPIALVDKPFEQRRDLLWVNLSGAKGHVGVAGGPQSGKSTVLRALITSLALAHTPDEVQMYALDFGGGALGTLSGLPHVGGVATRLSPETVRRMVAEMITLMAERERVFTEHGIDSMSTFRARRAEGTAPADKFGDVFLIVDGWGPFKGEYEQLEGEITRLATQGLSYGIHVVVSTNRWADVRPQLRDLLGTRVELRLGDPSESEIERKAARNIPEGRPGRGLTPDKLHFLSALPRVDGVGDVGDLPASVAQMVEAVSEAWTRPPAPPVRLLPQTLPADDVPEPPQGSKLIPIGIQESDLGPVYLDLNSDSHFLCFGDVETGKSALLRMIVQGITSRYTSDEARVIIGDYRRGLIDVSEGPHILGYGTSANVLTPLLNDVKGSMDRRLPGPDVTREQLMRRDWWSGPELFLVVDDYDMVASASGNPLAPLAELLPQARDIGLHVIVARRSAGAGRSLYEPVLQGLKEMGSPGIMLSGDRQEGTLLGNERPQELPPGRGMLVSRRKGTQLVQVGWVPPRSLGI